MKIAMAVLLTVWLTLASAQTQGTQQQKTADTAAKQTDAKDGARSSSQIAQNDAEYKIGPRGGLGIDVWKEPERSRRIPVRPGGRVTWPLLNDVQSAGL